MKTGTFRCYLAACIFLKVTGWKRDLFAFKGELDKKEKYWLNLGSVPCKQASRVFLIIIYIHSSAECTLCISYPRQSPSFCLAGFLVCVSATFTQNCGFDEAPYHLRSPRVYTGQQMGLFYSYVALFHTAWPEFVPEFCIYLGLQVSSKSCISTTGEAQHVLEKHMQQECIASPYRCIQVILPAAIPRVQGQIVIHGNVPIHLRRSTQTWKLLTLLFWVIAEH